MDVDLKIRTKAFALRAINVANALDSKKSTTARVIAKQVARSGTSVAANYRSARRGRSKAEFISKLHVATEECDETCFWLELAIEASLLPAEALQPLLSEADELTAILTSSLKTAKNISSK